MEVIMVDFLIDEKQIKRLENLAVEYSKLVGRSVDWKNVFKMMMIQGSSSMIDKKIGMMEKVFK